MIQMLDLLHESYLCSAVRANRSSVHGKVLKRRFCLDRCRNFVEMGCFSIESESGLARSTSKHRCSCWLLGIPTVLCPNSASLTAAPKKHPPSSSNLAMESPYYRVQSLLDSIQGASAGHYWKWTSLRTRSRLLHELMLNHRI